MFRLWAKIFKDNHLIKDTTIEDDTPEKTRTKKVLDSLNEVCHCFDLCIPIWLDSSVEEFRRHDKVRFYQDSFIEGIDFDFLEIHVIEED